MGGAPRTVQNGGGGAGAARAAVGHALEPLAHLISGKPLKQVWAGKGCGSGGERGQQGQRSGMHWSP